MTYYVPNMIFEEALKFYKKLKKIDPKDEFVFDFSRMGKFDPLPMLMMGATMRNYRNEHPITSFKVDGIDMEKKGYAGTMGFFKYVSPCLEFGKKPGEANGSNNYIPITPISVNKLQKEELDNGNCIPIGDIIEKESNRLSRVIDRGNRELHKLLTFLIREILRNTPEHAKTDTMWICGQFWKSYELAEIAIIDEGVGIYQSIKGNSAHRQYVKDNASALQWAIKAGISESFKPSRKQMSNDEWANSGFGLYVVSQICKYLDGSFCLISYGNYLVLDKEGITVGDTYFKGTAIRIKIPTKNIGDAQSIISKIVTQGEMEAKNIRNAFKYASTPSRGLIEKLNII